MAAEINQFSHADSLWTWKSNARSRKASVWIPYFESVEKVRGTRYRFDFNGGPLELDLKDIDTLLFYGAAGSVSLEFLDTLASKSITLLIHRRNIPCPLVLTPLNTTDQSDILTQQIRCREDGRRRLYVARTLIAARLASMGWLAPVPRGAARAARTAASLTLLRQSEAEYTKTYWARYYDSLGIGNLARRDPHPINAALDAGSFFLFGVVLRWTLFHRLSPAHGYMHEPTQYQSLVYDLMEPYRYVFESAVHEACTTGPVDESLTSRALSILKERLAEDAYVGAARANAKRKSLLHGVVLGLRAYLLGEMPRFVVPSEGGSIIGRPPKLTYQIPGAKKITRTPRSPRPNLRAASWMTGKESAAV